MCLSRLTRSHRHLNDASEGKRPTIHRLLMRRGSSVARVHNRSFYDSRLGRRPYSLLPERVPRVGATSALACRDQGTDASLCPHERRLRTLAPSAGRRGVGLLGREATRQGATGPPCGAATSERRRSHPPRARIPRPRGSCPRLARWLGQKRVARCSSRPRSFLVPRLFLSAAQPTVPIANNRTSTDRRARRAAISLFAQESAGIGDRARHPAIVGDPVSVWGRGRLVWPARAVVATGCAATERSWAPLLRWRPGPVRWRRGFEAPETPRTANRSTGSRPVRFGQARVRVRPGTVRERAERPRILSTSSQVPAPTKSSLLAHEHDPAGCLRTFSVVASRSALQTGGAVPLGDAVAVQPAFSGCPACRVQA